MKKIESFTVHHRNLKRGVYVSRVDTIGKECVTTFDVRMKEPNWDIPIDPKTQHTIEHLAATYLRNDKDYSGKVIYWGPMGCMTGSYLIMKGRLVSKQIIPLLTSMFCYISEATEIPGCDPDECGNYRYHDLLGAKYEAKKFLKEVLLTGETPTEYPKE